MKKYIKPTISVCLYINDIILTSAYGVEWNNAWGKEEL